MASVIDLNSNEHTQNPYDSYIELHKIGRVHWVETDHSWLVTGYKEIVEVLKNYGSFSSERDNPFDPVLLHIDPPQHTKNRNVLTGKEGTFSNDNVTKHINLVREIAVNLINKLEGECSFDLIEQIAIPFSSSVIFQFLGLPKALQPSVLKWSNSFVINSSQNKRKEMGLAWRELEKTLLLWVKETRENVGKTGLDMIIQRANALEFSDEDFVNILKSLLIGGSETTPNLVSSCIYRMLLDGVNRGEIQENSNLVEEYINEILRFESPIQTIGRIAKRDLALGNQQILEGQVVRVSLGAGNRDDNFFSKPNEFILGRDEAKILSFGLGPHYCLGAKLAKMEAMALISCLFDAFPNMKIEDTFSPLYKHSSVVRGLSSLALKID